ncbi:OstA-like protein [Calditrichota bacterium LG25]
MVRHVILLSLIIIANLFGQSQGIELIHADKHIGKKVGGEQLRIFEGNVHFQQDTIHMWCDRAVMYEEKEKIDFEDNVIITDGKSTIRARKIEYYWQPQQSYCYGQVRIKTEKDSLYSEYLEYNFKDGSALARENLYLFNRENLTHIWGQYGVYNPQEKFSQVSIQAHLMKIDSASNDTLNIFGQVLQYFDRKEERKAVAIDSVAILQGDLKAVCDTAIYWIDKDLAVLKHNPRAWYEDSRLKALEMEVYFDSLRLKRITLIGEAEARTLADSTTGEEDVLKGKLIHFHIKNKKAERIIAIDNASSLYYITDENGERGANYATADTIKIFFQAGRLDSISIIGGARGTYYPEAFKKEIHVE